MCQTGIYGVKTGQGPENVELFGTDSDQGQVSLRKPGQTNFENLILIRTDRSLDHEVRGSLKRRL